MGYLYRIYVDPYSSVKKTKEEKAQLKELEEEAVFKKAKNSKAPERFPSNGMESNPLTQDRVDLSKKKEPDKSKLPPEFVWKDDPNKPYLQNRADKHTAFKKFKEGLTKEELDAYNNQVYYEATQKKVSKDVLKNMEVLQRSTFIEENRDELIKQIKSSALEEKRMKWENDFYTNKRDPSTNAYNRIAPRYSSNSDNQFLKGYYNSNTDPNKKIKFIRLNDLDENGKPGTLHTLKVDPYVIDEINKFADQGQLDPQKRLSLFGLSANESNFGATRDIFGINDAFYEYGPLLYVQPDSYEAKRLDAKYNGDVYHDYWNFINEKTNGLTNLDAWNSGYVNDKRLNPTGETYADRIKRYEDKLLANPEFMQAAFGPDWQNIFKDRLNNSIAEQ